MGKMLKKKNLIIRTVICFILVLTVSLGVFHFIFLFQEKEGKLNATYTAEATIRKVETQISRYLENSDLFRNIISSGYTINNQQFNDLAGFMIKNKKVIDAYELAPEGVVRRVYPYKGNEEAVGLDMLENPDRKTEALLAKESREYTIAGPFELKQGGTGVLLFDPIYTKDGEEDSFWGFSILVINWENFLDELQIDKLSVADYHFDVWKKDTSGNRIDIMDCGHGKQQNSLQVPCTVPNDTWYFEIVPRGGWVPMRLKIMGYIFSILIAAFFATGYWQAGMRKIREEEYARQLEKTAKEAREANEAKTRFLFNMSHDIRTPMNAIVGYSELLEESLDDKQKAISYLAKIKASNSMLLSLINYILEMARIESGKTVLKEEKGNLKELLEILQAVSEPQILQKQLRCTWNFEAEHESVICDVTKVREIVLNIVSNAIKYTPEGGKIAVNIKELEPAKKEIADYCIIVEDNGIGMHEDYLPHIFEEFSREHTSTESKVSGAGLGLPIVKALVEMMNGRIEVESKINVGTRFSVFLSFPVLEEEAAAPVENKLEEGKKHTHLTGKRILVVEDNELNADIAKEILTRRNAAVDVTEDGSKCIERLDEKPEHYYDLILMDIQMPVMDGYDTTRAIRSSGKAYADIPIIAMTANAFDEDREQALQAGMNAHISKPIDVEKLIDVLSEML